MASYLRKFELRREAESVRRQAAYGLVMGWMLTLLGSFLFFCVPSRFDWLWQAAIFVGLAHLFLAIVLPQALAWPERAWSAVARFQGWVVMMALLTVVYFLLLWPAALFSRRRVQSFVSWEDRPPETTSAWEKLAAEDAGAAGFCGPKQQASGHYRSLPVLLASVAAFFFRRGDYLLLLIALVLIVLGLVLYFVQSSALAPFIYTVF